jgi:cytochrome c oxidase subunit 3
MSEASIIDMGEVVPYRPPHARDHATAYIGMVIFIAGWAMMFACFFFAYGALRVGATEWPPLGQPLLPIALPAVNTAVLALSSAALELGLWRIRRGNARLLAPSILAAALLGSLFLVIQYSIGADLFDAGLKPTSGPYASVFYGLAGIHAAHLSVGIVALLWLAIRAFAGAYNTPQHLPVRLWSVYWHFVGVIWLLMFVFVFIV